MIDHDMTIASDSLYVDDLRPCPDGWDVARSFHEAICMLEKTRYTVVSLDHDLGCFYGNKEMTGHDVLNWLIARKVLATGYTPSAIYVHSANAAKVDIMRQDILKYFGDDDEKNVDS